MLKQACLLLAIPLVVLANGCATIENVAGKDDLKIQDGYIYRGDKSFTVQAVHVPGLFEKGSGLEFMVPAMARIAEVGGNAIALDLTGFNDDGSALDPVSVNTVAVYAERAKDQRMVLVVRVLGDADNAAFRKNALEHQRHHFDDGFFAICRGGLLEFFGALAHHTRQLHHCRWAVVFDKCAQRAVVGFGLYPVRG